MYNYNLFRWTKESGWALHYQSGWDYDTIEAAAAAAKGNAATEWENWQRYLAKHPLEAPGWVENIPYYTIWDETGKKVGAGVLMTGGTPGPLDPGYYEDEDKTPPPSPPFDISWLLYVGIGIAIVAVLYWAYRRGIL